MQVRFLEEGERLIARPEARMEAADGIDFASAVEQRIQPNTKCVTIDLEGLDFVSLGGVRAILRLFGVDLDENRSMLTGVEELKSAVDLLHQEGGVERSDRDMVGGLLDLHELEVQDVMVHRTKMQSINAALPPAEVLREVLALDDAAIERLADAGAIGLGAVA